MKRLINKLCSSYITKKWWVILLVGLIILLIITYVVVNKINNNSETGKESYIHKVKTNKTEDDFEISEGDKLLQAACQNAINDYPEWTKSAGDIIVYENPNKGFYFRSSPEEPAASIDSPAQGSEIIFDMDFIDKNKITYVKKGNEFKIGTFEFELGGIKNDIIYEIAESISFIDISPLSEKEFVMFYIINGKAFIKHVDLEKSKEEIIFETPFTEKAKIAASPKGTYIYLLRGDILEVFNLSTKEKVYEDQSILSAIWIGDSYLLFSNSEETLIYNIKNKEKNKLAKLASAKGLSFSPRSGGVIGYNLKSEGKIINCQNWEILGTLKDGEIKTLANEKTAIISKENSIGYWRFFNNDWIVHLSENPCRFATIWKRY